MAVPSFQHLTLPLLKLTVDGEPASLAVRREQLAEILGLTEEDLAELLPSGTQSVFANRSTWAAVYLCKAGLLDRPKRGHYQITERGRNVLASPPEVIDVNFLMQYPEMQEFLNTRNKKSDTKEKPATPDSNQTPQELLEKAHAQLRATLADELLTNIKSCSPAFFEHLVVELLVKMGYGGSMRDAGTAIGKSGDEGIDGIIKEDKLGLDTIYIQAKRWEGTVGRPDVQKFVGALHGKHARKGVMITTGRFATGAYQYAATIDPKVVLIDGDMVADLMIDHGLGVTTHATYAINKIDSDYFIEE